MNRSCFNTVDDRPDMRYINRYVREEVCASGSQVWLDLGTELLDKKDFAALNKITSDIADCSTRCSKMFKLWLERKPGASWRHLITALKQIRMDNLASDVERLLLLEQTSKDIVAVDQQVIQSSQPIQQLQAAQNGMF